MLLAWPTGRSSDLEVAFGIKVLNMAPKEDEREERDMLRVAQQLGWRSGVVRRELEMADAMDAAVGAVGQDRSSACGKKRRG